MADFNLHKLSIEKGKFPRRREKLSKYKREYCTLYWLFDSIPRL